MTATLEKILNKVPAAIWMEKKKCWAVLLPSGIYHYVWKDHVPWTLTVSPYTSPTSPEIKEDMDGGDIFLADIIAGKSHEEDENIINTWLQINYLYSVGRGRQHPNEHLVKYVQDIPNHEPEY